MIRPAGGSSFESAKAYAFFLLKFRQRSRKELFERLRKKKFDPGTIERLLDFLQEKEFINDFNFARAWADSRIKKPLGLRRIERELKSKGIADELIGRVLNEARDGYCEKEVVGRIAQEKIEKLTGIEPAKAKKRLYAYLARRGFSPEIIIDTINNTLR